MDTTPIEPVEQTHPVGWHWYRLEAARDSVNAAFTALALPDGHAGMPDVAHARSAFERARGELDEMIGADGPADARHAADALRPRVQRAIDDLGRLGVAADPSDVQGVLTTCGDVLDHIEQALAGAGWD